MRMSKRQTNFMKRHLLECRYGIYRRYEHLDWAKPYHHFLCVASPIFLAGLFLFTFWGYYILGGFFIILFSFLGYYLLLEPLINYVKKKVEVKNDRN